MNGHCLCKKKNRRRIKACTLVALLLFALPLFPALAYTDTGQIETQGAPAQSNAGLGLGDVALSAIGAPAMAIVAAAAWLVQSLMALLLPIAGSFLDFGLEANVSFNPANMPVVQTAWRVTRDFANSFFILIVLWIAFTIIFNLQSLGGTKLLSRVVVIAVLINFSLAMVSAAFGITNAFAETFSKNMPRGKQGEIAAGPFIIGALNLQSLARKPTDAELANLKESARRNAQTQNAPSGNRPDFRNTTLAPSAKDTAIASLGIPQEAKAQGAQSGALGAGAGFGLGGLLCAAGVWLGPVGVGICTATILGTTILGAITGFVAGDIVGNLYRFALWYSIAAVFYTIAATTMIVGALTLIMRLVAMVYLSALAPLALATFVVPGGGLSGYFTMWKKSLISWATFAPMFYFLFYLSLFMLDQFTKQFQQGDFFGKNVAGDINVMLAALVVCMFMIAAVKIARATGDAVSTALTNIAKTAGGFALGAVAGGAIGVGARLGAKVITPEGRVVQTLRGIARRSPAAVPVLRATEQFIKSRQKLIEEEETRGESFSDDTNLAELRSAVSDVKKVARALNLAKSKSDVFLKELTDTERDQLLELATQSGVQKKILEKLPHLANAANVNIEKSTLKTLKTATGEIAASAAEKAVHEIMKGISFDDKMKLPKAAYEKKEVLRSLVLTSTPRNLSTMAEQKPEMVKTINEYLETLKPEEMQRLQNDMTEEQQQHLEDYWNGNFGRGIPQYGYKKPSQWKFEPELRVSQFLAKTVRAGVPIATGREAPRIVPSGGTGTYSYTKISGFVSSIDVNPASGVITGTIPAGTSPGTITGEVEVKDLKTGKKATVKVELNVVA